MGVLLEEEGSHRARALARAVGAMFDASSMPHLHSLRRSGGATGPPGNFVGRPQVTSRDLCGLQSRSAAARRKGSKGRPATYMLDDLGEGGAEVWGGRLAARTAPVQHGLRGRLPSPDRRRRPGARTCTAGTARAGTAGTAGAGTVGSAGGPPGRAAASLSAAASKVQCSPLPGTLQAQRRVWGGAASSAATLPAAGTDGLTYHSSWLRAYEHALKDALGLRADRRLVGVCIKAMQDAHAAHAHEQELGEAQARAEAAERRASELAERCRQLALDKAALQAAARRERDQPGAAGHAAFGGRAAVGIALDADREQRERDAALLTARERAAAVTRRITVAQQAAAADAEKATAVAEDAADEARSKQLETVVAASVRSERSFDRSSSQNSETPSPEAAPRHHARRAAELGRLREDLTRLRALLGRVQEDVAVHMGAAIDAETEALALVRQRRATEAALVEAREELGRRTPRPGLDYAHCPGLEGEAQADAIEDTLGKRVLGAIDAAGAACRAHADNTHSREVAITYACAWLCAGSTAGDPPVADALRALYGACAGAGIAFREAIAEGLVGVTSGSLSAALEQLRTAVDASPAAPAGGAASLPLRALTEVAQAGRFDAAVCALVLDPVVGDKVASPLRLDDLGVAAGRLPRQSLLWLLRERATPVAARMEEARARIAFAEGAAKRARAAAEAADAELAKMEAGATVGGAAGAEHASATAAAASAARQRLARAQAAPVSMARQWLTRQLASADAEVHLPAGMSPAVPRCLQWDGKGEAAPLLRTDGTRDQAVIHIRAALESRRRYLNKAAKAQHALADAVPPSLRSVARKVASFGDFFTAHCIEAAGEGGPAALAFAYDLLTTAGEHERDPEVGLLLKLVFDELSEDIWLDIEGALDEAWEVARAADGAASDSAAERAMVAGLSALFPSRTHEQVQALAAALERDARACAGAGSARGHYAAAITRETQAVPARTLDEALADERLLEFVQLVYDQALAEHAHYLDALEAEMLRGARAHAEAAGTGELLVTRAGLAAAIRHIATDAPAAAVNLVVATVFDGTADFGEPSDERDLWRLVEALRRLPRPRQQNGRFWQPTATPALAATRDVGRTALDRQRVTRAMRAVLSSRQQERQGRPKSAAATAAQMAAEVA